jgi:hypothetical protein
MKTSFFLNMRTSVSRIMSAHRAMVGYAGGVSMEGISGQSKIGAALFPHDPFNRTIEVEANRAEIDQGLGENRSTKKIELYVAACVVYGLPSGGRFRYTSFVQGLHRRSGEGDGPHWFDDNRTYPLDEIELFGMETGFSETT